MKDEAQPTLCLGDWRNAGELELLPKHPQHVRCGKENSEAILHSLMHLPTDERCHLWGACQHMGTIGDVFLQGLPLQMQSCVDCYALLYVGL